MSSRLQIAGRVTASVLLVATLSTGCGPTVPAKPTWTEDVRPILAAHCLRCHDGTGEPSADANEKYKDMPPNVLFPDQASTEALAKLINQTVRSSSPSIPFMPPPPAQGLDNWQLDTLANWAATVGK